MATERSAIAGLEYAKIRGGIDAGSTGYKQGKQFDPEFIEVGRNSAGRIYLHLSRPVSASHRETGIPIRIGLTQDAARELRDQLSAFLLPPADASPSPAPAAPPLETFLSAYLTAALWADLPWDDTDSPLPPSFPPPPPPGEFDPTPYLPHLSPQFRAQAEADCRTFLLLPGVLRAVLIGPLPGNDSGSQEDALRAGGRNLWLTRQRHGAGFWDGDYSADCEATLTAAAHTFPELYVTVAHDGLIYANR
jgi:hypothetical protein